jgi:lipoprotein-releasing system permease protein
MPFPFELLIGLRYTRAKRRSHFISFITLISVFGAALGVAALITVLSVMNGFERELRGRILGVVSHLTVSGDDGQLSNWRALDGEVRTEPGVVGAAPYVLGQAMVARGRTSTGVLVRGIEPELEGQVSDVGKHMVAGRLDALKPGEFGIVLGRELAWKLNVETGDAVTLVVPEANLTPAGVLPRLKRFTVTGIFEVGMYEYDAGLALVQLDDARKLYRLGDDVSGLRVKLNDVYDAPEAAGKLWEHLGPEYRVRDWTQEHANFFRALRMEKTVMFIILLLIVAVAAFNIISMLVMVVADKRSEIAILRTLGASPGSIMGIFMVQGSVVGIFGTLLGTLGGVALALNVETVVPFLEQLFNTTFLAKDVYYISELPSELRAGDVTLVTAASLLMGFLATIYPAFRAARMPPAEALRYE